MTRFLMDRRNLMKGLAALPALAAMDGCFEKCPAAAALPFNVVLHGSYALELDSGAGKAYVRLADLGDAHCYLAGYWGVEKPLDKGESLDITGVTGLPKGKLPQNLTDSLHDYVIDLKKNKMTQTNSERNLIVLPMPTKVEVGRSVICATGHEFFNNNDFFKPSPSEIPHAIVLRYSIPLEAAVVMSDNRCAPHLNFHIFGQPPCEPDQNHVGDAFKAVLKLYSGLDTLKVSTAGFTASCNHPGPDKALDGVDPRELEDLGPRSFASCCVPADADTQQISRHSMHAKSQVKTADKRPPAARVAEVADGVGGGGGSKPGGCLPITMFR